MTERTRSAVVTGAGQGLGRALAHHFARNGFAVIACDVNPASLVAVVDDVSSHGGTAYGVVADISIAADCERVIAEASSRYGDVDVLINNAAIRAQQRRPFWEIPEAEWDQFMAVNIRGTWLMMRAAAEPMRACRSGSIINVSSASVLEAPINQLQYIASKAAIIGMTRAAARELGEFNVRVNAILPSSITTEVPNANRNPESIAQQLSRKSLRRQQAPDDLVGVALFLATDAAQYITGQSLNVDGGANFL